MHLHRRGRLLFPLLGVLLAASLAGLPAQAQEGYNIVEIQTSGPAEVQQIADLGIDILSVVDGVVTAHVAPVHRQALADAGLDFTVTVEDVQAYAEALEAQWGKADLQYHTYDTINADLYALESSGIAKVYNIGSSVEGRDILAVRISDNPTVDEGEPAVMLVGCHHAREWVSVEVPYYIGKYLVDNYATDPDVQDLVDNGEIWVIPLLNPDGHQYTVDTYRLWRKNRRDNGDGTYGVDLNRNYATGFGGPGSTNITWDETYHGPSAFSEPETQALRDWFLDPAYNWKALISFHSYGQLVLYPWGYTYDRAPHHYKLDVIGQEMEDLIDAVHGANYTADKSSGLYLASGTTDDWTYDIDRIPSYTIELRPIGSIPGFQLPPSEIDETVDENIPAALYLIGLTQNDEDGDGVVEVDDNCMGASNPGQEDLDNDTVGPPCDCDDSDPDVSPGAEELCSNGVDDDCDGLVDGDDPDCASGGWGLASGAVQASSGDGSGSQPFNALGLLLLPGLFLVAWRVATLKG